MNKSLWFGRWFSIANIVWDIIVIWYDMSVGAHWWAVAVAVMLGSNTVLAYINWFVFHPINRSFYYGHH